MTILIINNYYKPENLGKIGQIVHALRTVEKTRHEIWNFSEINEKKIPNDVEAMNTMLNFMEFWSEKPFIYLQPPQQHNQKRQSTMKKSLKRFCKIPVARACVQRYGL